MGVKVDTWSSSCWRRAATGLPEERVSVKLIVLDCTASLNVAVAVVDTATFVAPEAGVSLVTLGPASRGERPGKWGPLMGSPALSLAPLTVAV